MTKPEWVNWLINTKGPLTTKDGKKIEVWELQHKNDEKALSDWAAHFRNHYCLDDEIDYLRAGFGYSRSEYLEKIKFPDKALAPGPSIRAGDFGEIIVADYLEYILGYWVPRTRYGDKTIRNESAKGCDTIGFKILDPNKYSDKDILAIFESKTLFVGKDKEAKPRLIDAVEDSEKDKRRKAESLNAIKQRLFDKKHLDDAKKVERFQNLEDRPCKEIYGAVALYSTDVLNPEVIKEAEISKYNGNGDLVLLVIHGIDMMTLVHALYVRAANEA